MRLFILFFILLQGVVSFAGAAEYPPGSTVGAGTSESGAVESDTVGDLSQHHPNFDSMFTLYQPYLDHVSAYQPMYFLVGTNPEKSKFQFSFKYRLVKPESSLAERYRFMDGFHFAYTQTSYWDLKSSSMPFEDTSYKPELFHISPQINTGLSPRSGLFLKTGIRHESNGQGKDISRNTNFLYANPIFVFYNEKSTFGFLISPKAWVYVGNDEDTNDDLSHYRGYFDLQLKCGLAESLVVESHLGWAQKGGSLQLDITYPLNLISAGISGLYLHVQYTNRLAESLLHYDKRTEAIRIGLSIVR
ncbi:MAG: phospholipase A [Desulfobacterales bacterium]|nr:phospholipase A [Desulfobacterales bacterium]MDX2510576.1 phospholipase A [Desulfobacterales bacterium]